VDHGVAQSRSNQQCPISTHYGHYETKSASRLEILGVAFMRDVDLSELVPIGPARFGFLSGKFDETRNVDVHSCLVAHPGAKVSRPRFLESIDR
jgi:hypothetical protein